MNLKKYIPMAKTAGVQFGGEIIGGVIGGRIVSKTGIPGSGKLGIVFGIAGAIMSGVALEYSGKCLDASFAPKVEEVIDAE